MEPIKKNYTWLYILIIIVLGGILVYVLLNSGKRSEIKADEHQNKAEIYSDSAKANFEQYKGHIVKDSVLERRYDELSKSINKIKIQTNEKNKVIDGYHISDMQSIWDSIAREGAKHSQSNP